ncbi:ATP-dependent DNA ligase [Nanoarchaeota archaeon]
MDYVRLAEVYDKLSSTSKRLEKTFYVSEALKAGKSELGMVIMLLQGQVFPAWEKGMKLGFANNYMVKAIQRVTGASEHEVEKLWAEKGDLGDVAYSLVTGKKQRTLFSSKLSVKKVYDNVRKLPFVEGKGSVDRKIQLVSELLSSASPLEAKYIVRTVLEIMRVGLGTSTMRDAIVWAYFGDSLGLSYNPGDKDFKVDDREEYNKVVGIVESAYEKVNDFSAVANLAIKGLGSLEKVEIEVGKPIKVMLAQKVSTVGEGLERVGRPAQLEFKYDGFRLQICKDSKGKVTLFTRRMEDVTKQFPDVVSVVSNIKGKDFVFDGEAVGFNPKTKKYTPFQNISQRIKRKHGIDEMSVSLPVEVNVFDVLYYEGKDCLKMPLKERRAIIEKAVKAEQYKIQPSYIVVTSDEKEAQAFYDSAKDKGMEGIMIKNLESPYKPGSRVGQWVKLKPTMETLDLVIVGAEWGEGKRSGWLTSFILACIDDNGDLLTIGKVGTGIKELEEAGGVTFAELTERLKPLIISEKGREVEVRPEIVIEVEYNEIQKSPTYTSGYALRFPRLKSVREDRGVEDASNLYMVEQFYKEQ